MIFKNKVFIIELYTINLQTFALKSVDSNDIVMKKTDYTDFDENVCRLLLYNFIIHFIERTLMSYIPILGQDEASDKLLDYMANIVHDIRTPTHGLVGFLDILQEQIKDKRLQEYIVHAKDSACFINELTSSILDDVAHNKELKREEIETVNTVKFFSAVAEIFSANISKQQLHYNIFIDPLLPKEIELNSMKTKRVIMNLIGNASKFTPKHGSIEFSVRYKQKEEKLHIFVKDSGIGIEEQEQKKIFEAFEQADGSTREIYGGTGLGLSISAKYVKDMGSKLSLESKPNFGSTFYFDLPVKVKEATHQFEPIQNTNTTVTILMSNHNAVVANHITRYLVKAGVKVDNITSITHRSQIENNVTHFISFQNKIDYTLLVYLKENNIKSLVVEENFLSLNMETLHNSTLISQHTFFGTTLYSFVNDADIPKILIIEDDNASRKLITLMLEDEYCQIDLAKDGAEGLEFLTQSIKDEKPYDIVYTDHNLPILSGAELLRKYRKLETPTPTQRTVTVSISGYLKGSADYEDEYDYFVIKPYRKKEITSLLLNTVKNKK